MATTAPTTRPMLGRTVRANLPTAELYEAAVRHGEGLIAADGPLVVRTGRHTGRSPEDKFIVDEPTSHDAIWWGNVNRPISEANYERLRARLIDYAATKDLYSQDCFIGAAAAHRRSLRVYTETAWASIFARNLFRRPSRRAGRRLPPELHDHLRPVVPGGPRDRRHPHRDRHPRPPPPDGGDHRRDRVRGRDQEERVHRHELPHARRGRPADALGHQRGTGRRPGGLLRPVGDGQDDPVGRSPAQPHRRRRARLGRWHHLQLRGWLLRQDHPPVADVRARHLPDDAALRDRPRERRPRPADARARPRLGAVHREHARRLPARIHRQRRRDRGGGQPEGRRLPDRRRVRRAAADLQAHAASRPPITSSAATRPSWPARRSGCRSRRRPSRPASGRRSCRVIRASTPTCWSSASSATTSPCGWSTPAGPVAPMASDSA